MAKERQFVICTHERIKRGDWGWLYTYRGSRRQIIWDEALLATKTSHINTDELSSEMSRFSDARRRWRLTAARI